MVDVAVHCLLRLLPGIQQIRVALFTGTLDHPADHLLWGCSVMALLKPRQLLIIGHCSHSPRTNASKDGRINAVAEPNSPCLMRSMTDDWCSCTTANATTAMWSGSGPCRTSPWSCSSFQHRTWSAHSSARCTLGSSSQTDNASCAAPPSGIGHLPAGPWRMHVYRGIEQIVVSVKDSHGPILTATPLARDNSLAARGFPPAHCLLSSRQQVPDPIAHATTG